MNMERIGEKSVLYKFEFDDDENKQNKCKECLISFVEDSKVAFKCV